MKLHSSLSILGAALLAGCALVPGHVVSSPDSAVTLQPKVQGSAFSAQAVVDGYDQSDIKHLTVRVFELKNGSEQAVEAAGSPLQKDILGADIGKPVVFSALRSNATYRFRAYAYADAGTERLISTDAKSYVDLTLKGSAPQSASSLPVTLANEVFSGQATASGLVFNAGGITYSGTSSITLSPFVPSGQSSTLAGLAGQQGTVDGIGTAARLKEPTYNAVDAEGNVYVSDLHAIRKITPAGEVSTFAGSVDATGKDDGVSTAARFQYPSGLAVYDGCLYVADTGNHTIRKIVLATREVTTLAGLGWQSGALDGVGSAARFKSLEGLAADGLGNLYATEYNDFTIRKIVIATGAVTTFAGVAGQRNVLDGNLADARFFNPSGIAADAAGNVYVAEATRNVIRKISSAGVVSTIAGEVGTGGTDNGIGSAARFYAPRGMALDGQGGLYIADQGNHAIRQLNLATHEVVTFAGTVGQSGDTEGVGPAAKFNVPIGVAAHGGYLFVADAMNYTVRKIKR